MESILCGGCRRELAEADFRGELSIKCPRCGVINHIQRAESPAFERQGAPPDHQQ